MHSFMELIVEIACYLLLIIALNPGDMRYAGFSFAKKKPDFSQNHVFLEALFSGFFFVRFFFRLKMKPKFSGFFFAK